MDQILTKLGFGDIERELTVTRRVLERLPEAKFGWKPHEKSMPLGRLVMHVANLVDWATGTLATDGFDMQSPPKMRQEPTGLADVLETFDRNVAALREAMSRTTDERLAAQWTLRNGEQILYQRDRATVLRVWCLSHLVHHRGQLCLLLRLLDVPVPAVYFNSADEPEWKFE